VADSAPAGRFPAHPAGKTARGDNQIIMQ